ncbi:unnamed protein product [Lathyrus sativus]|nr:unnamed protein product [Lathyrus sativus]
MYPFERMMGDFKRLVKNKARVEGSICMSYLHRETTYFCSHYFKTTTLSATSKRNEALGLNDDVVPTLSISNPLGRPSGKSQIHWLTDAEWRSSHVHILINCNEVKPYINIFLQNKSINEEDPSASTLIHGEFPEWFREYATNEGNGMTDKKLISLAWGPESNAMSWHKYFINGYKFHTQAWSQGKKTINSGVYVKGITEGGEDDFYGAIKHIFELEYHELSHKVALFYCQWFDPKRGRGTKVHPHYDIVDIKMNKKYDRYDPFIISQKAKQVYYVPYPEMRVDKRGWCAVIKTKPRGRIEVVDIDDDTPYQDEEMAHVEQITEIEDITGLHDETHSDEEVDVTLISSMQINASADNDYREDNNIDDEVTNTILSISSTPSKSELKKIARATCFAIQD